TSAELATAAVTWPDTERTDSTVIAQAARPAATPAFGERVTVAAASARADTAVIGSSQPKVTAAAAPDAAEAASPRAAFNANTTTTRTSSTIRWLTVMLCDSSQAGSIPGP